MREGDLADGWRAVPAAEGASVIGHCSVGLLTTKILSLKQWAAMAMATDLVGSRSMTTARSDRQTGGRTSGQPEPPCGMPVYDFMPNRAALRIVDAPVGLQPTERAVGALSS